MSRVASLQVEIGANVSGFQAAAAQVKSGLKSIENAAKSAGGGIAGAGSRIDQFNAKARALEEAYATGTISARQYASQGRALAWSMMTAGEKFDVVRQKVSSAGMELVKLGAAGAAVGLAAKKVYEFAATGAQIEYTQQKFDRLAKSVGSTGDVFMNDLRLATRGTVSDFDLLKQGADLLQLGLAKDTAEAARLSRVMTALGMDTGEMTLALANQSKRRLDQLGLSLSRFNQIEAGLKDKGMTKEEAFKEAFLQTAEQTVMITGNQADSQYGNFLRFQAEAANIWNDYKQALPSASMGPMFGSQNVSTVMGQLAQSMKMWRSVMSGEMKFGPTAWNAQSGRFESEMIPQWAAWRPQTPQSAGFGQTQAIPYSPITAAENARDNARYAAMLSRGGTGAGGGAGTEAPPEPMDYASALSTGLDLTNMTKEYSDKTAILNDKLAEESDKLAELTRRYGENSRHVEEQREKVNGVRADIEALGESFRKSNDMMALGMLKSRDETGKLQMEYARASGLITRDAYEQWEGLTKLSDAYAQGKLNAEEYTQGVRDLDGLVAKYAGASFSAYLDFYIRVHGEIPTAAGGVRLGAGGGSGRGTCFVTGTLVTMADGTRKRIEEVRAGDAVRSFDTERGEFMAGVVTQTFRHEASEYLNIDGLLVTPEHPVWIVGRREWATAGEVNVGDVLYRDYGGFKPVQFVIRVQVQADVYNLEVEGLHNYFAGGVLVHNKITENDWTGGPLNSSGFTIVGDAPGGSWGPWTEVIGPDGYVYNAEQAKILKRAGLLEGATAMREGTEGYQGSYYTGPRVQARRFTRSGSRNITGRAGSTSGGGTTGTTAGTEDVALIAATVSEQAVSTAQAAIAAQQSTTNGIHLQTQQTVQATQRGSQDQIEELREIQRLLKKLPDVNAMYEIYKTAGQQAI